MLLHFWMLIAQGQQFLIFSGILKNQFQRTATSTDSGGKAGCCVEDEAKWLLEREDILKTRSYLTPHIFLAFPIHRVHFQRLKTHPPRFFFKRITFTFVGYDAVTYLLEDLSQAGGTSHLEVLLSCRQAPRPHRARRLQRRELGHEHVWERARRVTQGRDSR